MAEHTGRNVESAQTPRAAPGRLRARLWSLSLFASIVVAGLHLYPSMSGRVILALIGGGFLLFGIARTSVASMHSGPPSCGHLLAWPMRVVYWTGYALMICGVLLTPVAALLGI